MAGINTIEGFIKDFSRKSHFTKNDLLEYYLKSEHILKDGTLRRRINILKERGLIQEISKGVYSSQKKSIWIPVIDNKIKSTYKKVEKQYNDLNFTIWSTAWLSDFTNLQAFRHLITISVEKDFAESVFEYLKEEGYKNIYFQPDKKEVQYYISDSKETYIIENSVTRSPSQLIEEIKVPKLEKILVDLYCEKDLFNAYQGSELKNIFRKAFKSYVFNISSLLNYSARRGRKVELIDFIETKTGIKLPIS